MQIEKLLNVFTEGRQKLLSLLNSLLGKDTTKNKQNDVDTINPAQIAFKRLKKYNKNSLLENYALYMGKCQILELGLANLLVDNSEYEHDQVENWSMGRIVNELERIRLREDFIAMLGPIIQSRNHIAHEFLANRVITMELTGGIGFHSDVSFLSKAAFELEQALIIFAHMQEKNGDWFFPET